MIIIPAIDIKNGRCVRLKQGQFDQMTEFDISPVERAAYFATMGAKRLHVVDLDGAQHGSMQQLSLICSMNNPGMILQAGGGIRSLEQAELCFNSGISQLVLGSIAINDPKLTVQIIEEIGPQHIVLAVDVRVEDNVPKPATHGWQTTSDTTLWEVISYYEQIGIRKVLCTDIACDGMMNGPNFDLYQQAVAYFPNIEWQASGGIRNQKDIDFLDSLGVAGAILGLALYQGTFEQFAGINAA